MTIAIAHGTSPSHVSTIRTLPQEFLEIGNVCYDFSVVLPIPPKQVEMTDKELLLLMGQSKTFDFWNDKEENIYSISDGTPL